MNTAQNLILDYFMRGHSLTVVSCRERFHTTELRRVVSRLRKRGYDVIGRWKTENGYRFKRYFIPVKPEYDPDERRADRAFCGSLGARDVNPFINRRSNE